MDKDAIIKLIYHDNLMDAVDLFIKENDYKSRDKTLKLLKGRLATLEMENMEGILDRATFTLRKNRLRKNIIELIDFDISEALPIEIIMDSLKEEKVDFDLGKIEFKHKEEHSKFLARLAREYKWSVIIPVEIDLIEVKVEYKPLTKDLVITADSIVLSPNFTIDDQSSHTVEEETSLWTEEIARDGIFWQGINQFTKSKVNEKMETDRYFTDAILNRAIDLIQERISKIVGKGEIGDNKIVVKVDKILGYDDFLIKLR